MAHAQDLWFEVTSDVLFLDGRKLLRGNLLSGAELGDRRLKMLELGMVRFASVYRLAA
jgi:hypothetical protein